MCGTGRYGLMVLRTFLPLSCTSSCSRDEKRRDVAWIRCAFLCFRLTFAAPAGRRHCKTPALPAGSTANARGVGGAATREKKERGRNAPMKNLPRVSLRLDGAVAGGHLKRKKERSRNAQRKKSPFARALVEETEDGRKFWRSEMEDEMSANRRPAPGRELMQLRSSCRPDRAARNRGPRPFRCSACHRLPPEAFCGACR